MESFEIPLSWPKIRREEGFSDVPVSASELDEEDGLPLVVRQLQEKNYVEERECFLLTTHHSLDDPQEARIVQCYDIVLDQVIQSLECNLEQLKTRVKLFGFKINFQSIQLVEIRKRTADLGTALIDRKTKQITDGR